MPRVSAMTPVNRILRVVRNKGIVAKSSKNASNCALSIMHVALEGEFVSSTGGILIPLSFLVRYLSVYTQCEGLSLLQEAFSIFCRSFLIVSWPIAIVLGLLYRSAKKRWVPLSEPIRMIINPDGMSMCCKTMAVNCFVSEEL